MLVQRKTCSDTDIWPLPISPPLTLFILGFFGFCSTGGGVFQPHPLTPLSLKFDDSNFVRNYFGEGSIF